MTRVARILNTLQQPFVVEGQVLEVGASIGIALYPSTAATRARSCAAPTWPCTRPSRRRSATASIADEQERASPISSRWSSRCAARIERDEFELYYQPKRHLRSGLMTRRRSADPLEPSAARAAAAGEFIPIAERTGLIKPMTDWILDGRCSSAASGRTPARRSTSPSTSRRRVCSNRRFRAKVQSLLDKWNDRSALPQDRDHREQHHGRPGARAGDHVDAAVDGRAPVDRRFRHRLLVADASAAAADRRDQDRQVVRASACSTSDADAAIVRTIIDLAHNLGKQVCAEGVEDAETWRRLADMGCDLAQGYWMSKPLNAEDLMKWLVDTAWGLKFRTPM